MNKWMKQCRIVAHLLCCHSSYLQCSCLFPISSRKGAKDTALSLIPGRGGGGGGGAPYHSSNNYVPAAAERSGALQAALQKTNDKDLRKCLASGIGFHNAGE